MANSCITANEQERIAKAAIDNMSKEQKDNYGITSENQQTAENVLHCIVSTELKESPKREELQNDPKKFLDYLENNLSKLEVSSDSIDHYNDMQDLFLSTFDSRFAEFDTTEMSEQNIEEDDRMQILQLCGDLVYVYKDPEGKYVRAFLKEPVEISKQEITLRKIKEIASFDVAQEFADNSGHTYLVRRSKKERAPYGTHKTGRYLYRGKMVDTITVSEDVYGDKKGNFPILSSPIGNATDLVGRLYFNKESTLWNPDGAYNEAKLESLEKTELDFLFTRKGLLNLLNDFKELEKQLQEKWPGCKFITDEIDLMGQISKDKWITGKPDLIVVDREGVAHVLDFKTHIIKKVSKGLSYQDVLKGSNDYTGAGESYGKQMSRYIRILQSLSVNTSEIPYAVLIDTWYDTSDLGDSSIEGSQHTYDKIKDSKGEKGFALAKNGKSLASYIEDTTKDIGHTPGLQDVMEDADGTIYYIEPRLHTASDMVDGKMQYSSDLAALRGPEEDVPFDEQTPTYLQQFLDATEEEKRIYEQQDGKPRERKLTQGITKLGTSDIESDESPIGSQELMAVAEWSMHAVSDLIGFIQGGAEFDIFPSTKDKMLKGKSHAEIIKSIGIDNLIDFVFDNKIAIKYDEGFPVWDKEKYPSWKEFSESEDYDLDWYPEEESEYMKKALMNSKAKWLIDHKKQFQAMGFTKLMALEKTLKPQRREDNGEEQEAPNSPDQMDDKDIKLDSGDNEANDEFAERYIEGLTDVEAWMLNQRNYSVKASLAQEIRRMLENIILKDEKGNIVLDPYGWDMAMHLDSTEAMQMLLDALKNCESFEEMKAVLKGMAVVPQTNWAQDILNSLDADKNLKAKFYRHFRKDALTYSVSSVKIDPVTGRKVVETRIINTRPAYATIIDSLSASFMSGTVGNFNGKPMISDFEFEKDGIKDVNSFIESKIHSTRDRVRALYKKKGKRKGDELSEYIMNGMMDENEGPSILSDITEILNGIGVMVSEDVVERCCASNVARSYGKSNAGTLLDYSMLAIVRLRDQRKGGALPQSLRGNDAFPQYKKLLITLADSVESVIEASSYEGGKTYYSYTNPSRLGHIIRNLKDSINSIDPELAESTSKFEDYIQDSFGRYEGWFKSVPDENGKTVWLNDWLKQLESSSAARTALAHKVELSYIGNHYRDLGSLGFQLSILHNYFGTKDDEELRDGPDGNKIPVRWFALPTMSNKATNEFIRMTIYTGDGRKDSYKDEIVEKVLMNTFLQERNRIADTLYHYIKHTSATDQIDILDPIKKKDKLYDLIKKDIQNSNPEIKEEEAEEAASKEVDAFKERIRTSSITLEDLKKVGRITSGAKFHFLWYLNDAIRNEDNSEFAENLVNSINVLLTPNDDAGKERKSQIKASYSEADLLEQTEGIIRESMDTIVRSELDNMHKIGLFDTVQRKYKSKDGKEHVETTLKYWEEFNGKLGDVATVEAMEKELTNFIWQDIAANINIVQITGGDLAFYGNAVNYQKRIAQIHSPGLHLIHDEDYDDGYLRSVHISDHKAVSEILSNAELALNEYMDTIEDPEAKKEYGRLIAGIINDFKDYDITDGQAYSCPTSKRKKLALQGEWDDEREKAYKKIIQKGDFSIANLKVLMQPDKPFATSDMAKYSGSPTMTLRRTPLQDKNSEYLILLAEALSRGAGKQSRMSAIFDFMEATVKKDKDGNPINKNGIDTVHFASVGKVGVSGVIDIDAFDWNYKGSDEDYHKELTKYMLEHVLPADTNAKGLKSRESTEDRRNINNLINEGKLKPEEAYYNPVYVDTIPLDDYIIQQEVPAHLYDPNGQLYGSQIRILGISDITPDTEFRVWNAATKKYDTIKDQTLIEEYKQLHADNIEDSFNSLMEELGLRIKMEKDGKKVTVDLPEMDKMTQEQRDSVYKKMAYILRKEIVKDAKYGLDAMRACSLRYDENNIHVVDFNVPLMDPIQSKRIQMLINSIIKKVINKQKINGGPVVQVTSYDKDLHVRFQDVNGNLLPSLEDFYNKEDRQYSYQEFMQMGSYEKSSDPAQRKLYNNVYKPIVEEYKKEIDGKQAGIAHFECYMSVPNEKLEKLITKEDGSLMTIEEIQKQMPDVWESMSQVIGYRIPTEDKYSMLPLKIMGFVPKASGQVIIMPKEITLLTGSDFDIDKMYIMMKAFDAKRVDTRQKAIKQLRDEYIADMTARHQTVDTSAEPYFEQDTERIVQNAARIINDGDDIALSDGIRSVEDRIPKVYQDFINWYRNRLVSSTFSEYSNQNADSFVAKKSARDNRLLDLQWAVLTNKDTAAKMLNPGNFNPQKKVGRVIRIIKSKIRSAEDFDDLMAMSNSQLDALLESSDQHSITLPSSKIYFQRQNMQGTQMVGIFANNNVSHAFCSMQKIGIDLTKGDKSLEFCIGGKRIGNVSTPDSIIVLDPQRGFDGQLISKTIASFLAASVDTAKDPVLNDLNVNTFTGGVAMALARMGFDTTTIGLFLSQPAIVMLSDHYFKNKTDGYYGGDTAIREVADMLGIDSDDLDSPTEMGITDRRLLSNENLVAHLADSDFYSPDNANNTTEAEDKLLYQKQVLAAFKILFKIAKDLQELTFCTKFNSVSNAVGPTIADTLEDKDRVEKFTRKEEENVFYVPKKKNTEREDINGFTDAAEVIENDTILSAFYNNTVGDGGASERIFKNFFPHYWVGFQQVVKDFKDNFTRKDKISSKLYNQLLDEYLYFLLTYNGKDGEDNEFAPVLPVDKEDRDTLIKDLIKEFEDVLAIPNRKPNMILDMKLGRGCLSVRKADEYLAVDVLAFNGAQMNSESQDKVKRAWSDLIQSKDPDLTKEQNEKLRRFGTDLFFYTLMRNGFGFSPKTLMHLASVIVRYNATYPREGFRNYIDGLLKLKDTDAFLLETSSMYRDRFINQFIRNHANNRNIVPNVQATEIKMETGADTKTGEKLIEFHSEKKHELRSVMRSGDHPCKFITVTSKDPDTHKLTQELFELDTRNGETYVSGGETRVRYRKSTRLGVVNNFIEYNANDDLKESYFTEIRNNSIDSFDDEDTAKSNGREEQQDGDAAFSDMEIKNVFIRTLMNLDGPQAKDSELRKKIFDFASTSNNNKVADAVTVLLNKAIDSKEKQQALDRIQEEMNKCNNL